MATNHLFDEKTRRKLEQLMLHAQRVRAGAIKGERRSVKRGTSIEFASVERRTVTGGKVRQRTPIEVLEPDRHDGPEHTPERCSVARERAKAEA